MRPFLFLCCFIFAFQSFGAGCEWKGYDSTGLNVREGYTDFIQANKIQPFKNALPTVNNSEINSVMRSADTMWYDEESMVFYYQDSIETVVGGRANCVGRLVGERNQGSVIGKLMNYFGADYKFMFPFRTAAGTDNVTNVKVFNFWAPPKKNGAVLPVRYWKMSSRGRWRWVFPVGTIFGEVLYQKGPGGRWLVFEIRTRKRYISGWEVDIFRPFAKAISLANSIRTRRPMWYANETLKKYVKHLLDNNTLTPHQLVSPAYGKVFPTVHGALDVLPDSGDVNLIADILSQTTFVSTQGVIWKENGSLETYAPASASDFNIVPRGYEMGMIPVNEVSCKRCHEHVGRRLGEFEGDIVLYGEIWGEDNIFTWHLFQPNSHIYGTFDDADTSRVLNPRLAQANLVKQGKPNAGDPIYKPMPSAFTPIQSKESLRNNLEKYTRGSHANSKKFH